MHQKDANWDSFAKRAMDAVLKEKGLLNNMENEKECSCDCISMNDVNKMPVHSVCGKIIPKDKFSLLMSPSASYMCDLKHDPTPKL